MPDTNSSHLPTIRLRQSEMDRVFSLFAAAQEIVAAKSDLQQRIKAVPNGYRNIRLVEVTLSRLLEEIVKTIPVEKLVSIQRLIPRISYKVYFNGSIGKMQDDETIISIKDLDALCKAAHEHCVFCDKNCGQCELGIGKVFDRVLKINREKGESWAFFRFDNLTGNDSEV
jgi:hypothetical protein